MERNEEFTNAVQEMLEMTQELYPERMNAKLKLTATNCVREEKRAEIDFSFTREELDLNPYGGVHGGIVCTVFDTAMGIGCVALCGHLVTTTDLSTSYLRALNGEHYRIHTEYTHIGSRLINCLGYIYDTDNGDELCSTCMATYMQIAGEPKGLRV